MSRYDIEKIMFIDELFASNFQYLKRFTTALTKRSIRYWVQTRVDMVNENTLNLLKNSGCYEITFGVEHVDDHILNSMRKNITKEKIERAFEMAKKVGLHAKGYIIFGDVEETAETIHKAVTWWKNHPDYDIRLWWILTFPGSQLYDIARHRRIITDPVKYLRENRTQLNLSKMSDMEYWNMVSKVELYQILISDGMNFDFGDIQQVTHTLRKNLKSLMENHVIAIWPATEDNLSMLEYVSHEFVSHQNVHLVNINPNDSFVLGIRKNGKKVQTPDEVVGVIDIDVVLYAFGHRSSGNVYSQICMMCQKYYLNVKQVIKLSELVRKT